MTRRMRIARRIAITAAVVVFALAGIGIAGYAYLQSAGGRRALARIAGEALSLPGTAEVRITGIAPGLPARLAVDRLEIRDPAGAWLRAEDAVLTWRPLELLAGRLHVTELRISRLRLDRLPQSARPAAGETAPGLPSLPIGVRIDDVRLLDLVLGGAIAGEPVRLDVSARLAAVVRGVLRSELDIERTDGGGGRATVSATFDPGAETLTVNAEAEEPAGGTIGRALGLTPSAPITVRLSGAGPLADWQGSVHAAAEGLAAIDAELRIQRGERWTASLAGRANIAALFGAEWRPLLGEVIGVHLRLGLTDVERFEIERLELTSAALAARGSGRVDLADGGIDAAIGLTVRDAAAVNALTDPLRAEAIGVEVHLSGALGAPDLALTGRLERVVAPGVSADVIDLRATATVPPPSAEGGVRDIKVEAATTGLAVDETTAAALIGDSLTLSAHGRLDVNGWQLDRLRAEASAAHARLTTAGRLALAEGASAVRLVATLDDLAVLSPTLGLPIAGRGELTASLRGRLQSATLQGSAALALSAFTVGQPLADSMLGPMPGISADYVLNGTRSLVLGNLRIEGAALAGRGRVALEDGFRVVRAELALNSDNAAALAARLGVAARGKLAIDAALEGAVVDPALEVRAELGGLTVGGIGFRAAAAKLAITDAVSRPAGTLSLAARSDLGPLKAATRLAVENWRHLRLSGLSAAFPGITAAGDVDVALSSGIATGRLAGQLRADRSPIAVAGYRVSGSAKGEVRLAAEGGEQVVDLTLSADPLVAGAVKGTPVRAERLRIAARLSDPAGLARGRIEISAGELSYGGLALAKVKAEASGATAKATYRIDASGPPPGSGTLAAEGTVAVAGRRVRLTVDRLEGKLGKHALALERPAAFTYRPGLIEITGFAFKADGGRITADGRLGAAGKAAITVSALPVAVFGLIWPQAETRGTIDASAELGTEHGLLAGRADIKIGGIGGGTRGLTAIPKLSGEMHARWSAGVIAAEGEIDGLGEQPLSFSGRVPFAVEAAGLRLRAQPGAAIEGSAQWQGEVEPLSEALPLGGSRLSGKGRLALRVRGTVAGPRLSGELTVRGGTFEQPLTGTLIERLEARAWFEGGDTLRLELSGTDGGEGRISASGEARLSGFAAERIELATRFDAATLIRRDDVTAAASGRLKYAGGAERGRLEGTIETTRVEVRLIDRLPPSVVDLNAVEVGLGPDRAQRREAETAPLAIDLDLGLELPRRVFIRGRGLDSEWKGAFRVSGSADAPKIDGALSLVRGEFLLIGKRFVLSKGEITLDGSGKVDPELDIAAEYTANDITATVTVGGRVSHPDISLSSSPALPEGEILPRVLFGKNASELGPAEAVQIALGIDSLARGGGLGEQVLGTTRDLLGVDVLSLDTSGSEVGDTTVRVGRYVGENIYIESKLGREPGSRRYRAEVKLGRGFSAESEVGENAQGSIGLKWEMDY